MTGGTIVLFDRKMLRNFRKDGHNWKKKNDGKTVKEAHEHLKVRFSYLLCAIDESIALKIGGVSLGVDSKISCQPYVPSVCLL